MARPSKPWYRASKNTWYCTIDGRKVSLGVRGRKNVKAAKEAWHRLVAKVPPPREQAAQVNVRYVVEAFLDDAAGRVKPKTLACYSDFLRPFAAVHGDAVATELPPTVAEAYSRKPQWCDNTRHDFLGSLVTAFRWALRARLIDRNPLHDVKRPPRGSRGADVLVTPSQHLQLLEAATPQFRLVLDVLWQTGARPGEAAAITAENFDAEAGIVRLREHKTSHKGRGRVLLLTPALVEVLRRQRERYPSGPLLRNRCGRPWVGGTIVKAMEVTRQRAGIGHTVAYGLRHSFATDALERGVSEAIVAELLGHVGTKMISLHYGHLNARRAALRDALARVR
jgi:integrase